MKQFDFSVIIPIYNCELWLREAIDSVIAQDCGFNKVQLILVDDGSKDGSGSICDEYTARYPENIFVIHQENQGVSAARNHGMELIAAPLTVFLDADDKYSKNFLSEAGRFFAKFGDQTDVVAFPIQFFGAKKGSHIQNTGKFNQGSRVINLSLEPNILQTFASNTVFITQALKKLRFDQRLAITEDGKLLAELLRGKKTLGVCPKAIYKYRRRESGPESAIQNRQTKKTFYLDTPTHYYQDIIKYYHERNEDIPMFLQFTFAYDIGWRFAQKDIRPGVLSGTEMKEYLSTLEKTLQSISDEAILAQQNIPQSRKYLMMANKHHGFPRLHFRKGKCIYSFTEGQELAEPENIVCPWFLNITSETVTLECKLNHHLFWDEGIPQIRLQVGNEFFEPEVEKLPVTETHLGKIITQAYGLKWALQRYMLPKEFTAKLVRIVPEGMEHLPLRAFGRFFPLDENHEADHWYREGLLVRHQKNELVFREKKHIGCRYELEYILALLQKYCKSRNPLDRKFLLQRVCYWPLRLLKRKPIWLITDRVLNAGDNGEAFFRWMRDNHGKKADLYFALSSKSRDYPALKDVGKIVEPDTMKYKVLWLLSDYIISSRVGMLLRLPFGSDNQSFHSLQQPKYIFLQHGVTKDDISDFSNRYIKNITGFVTVASAEQRSIIEGSYSYEKKSVWLTGFPRFDQLFHNEQRQITILPTWRQYLIEKEGMRTESPDLSNGFTETAYYHFYNDLLHHTRLLTAAEEYGYSIALLLHPNMQGGLSDFSANAKVKILDDSTSYRDVYAQSDLVVTDYSSAVFDFAWLKKPVLYCQFDKETFFSGAHSYTKGYFDYERDGFGEVTYDLESLVDLIIEYMENGCKLKDKYRERIESFFAYFDRNNCQRVYEKIIGIRK